MSHIIAMTSNDFKVLYWASLEMLFLLLNIYSKYLQLGCIKRRVMPSSYAPSSYALFELRPLMTSFF